MDKLKILGKAHLSGSIFIPGAKNAALPIMICSLLSNQKLELTNIPNLEDIITMKKLLESFGLKFQTKKDSLSLLSNDLTTNFLQLYYNLVLGLKCFYFLPL